LRVHKTRGTDANRGNRARSVRGPGDLINDRIYELVITFGGRDSVAGDLLPSGIKDTRLYLCSAKINAKGVHYSGSIGSKGRDRLVIPDHRRGFSPTRQWQVLPSSR
jgi:hypothetical protein